MELREQLTDIVSRLPQIEARRKQLQEHDYEYTELTSEANELQRMKVVAERQLAMMTMPPDPEREKRRTAIIERNFEEQRANIARAVDRFEKAGDHRNAKLWRLQLIGLRAKIAATVT
ncbi:MAG TPA: hypothetical protein VJ890_05635 [Vineibacter sp.]|nr:hypothetical protein [Vineibacter sp.]